MRFNRSDLADFAYFLAVARHLNFRQAGLELGVSASAVSHALKSLEGRVGVRLLNRTNRSVTLTAAGEEFKVALERPFEDLRHASEVLDRFRDTPSGRIRINVLTGAAELLLAPVLPAFFDRYPEIMVEIGVTDKMIDVTAGGYDAGIRFGGTVPEDMVAQHLTPPMRWTVAGSASYLAQHGTPRHPNDLMQHRCVRTRLGDGSVYLWEFEKDGEELVVDVPGPLVIDSGAVALKLALKGFGLVYMNEWDLVTYKNDGSLSTVLDDWSARGEGFHMYYSSRRQVPKGVRLLIDLIRELKPLG
ncbi:LysR family transcriptional regulator [Oryzifoliimicrobium ureilyticus]|uniref:LysR family transcriptional regulator n=1 Tax=Oryzifoliimicrobium ureilyticus TaxID=3113724 RepID=UPI00307612DA